MTTFEPLNPEAATRLHADLSAELHRDIYDCQPDDKPEQEETYDRMVTVVIGFLMLIFLAACLVAALYAFGIL